MEGKKGRTKKKKKKANEKQYDQKCSTGDHMTSECRVRGVIQGTLNMYNSLLGEKPFIFKMSTFKDVQLTCNMWKRLEEYKTLLYSCTSHFNHLLKIMFIVKQFLTICTIYVFVRHFFLNENILSSHFHFIVL